MRRIAGNVLVICLVFSAALAVSVTKAAGGASDEQGFQQASQAFAAARAKEDAAAVAKLLDANFQWFDKNGKLRTKVQVLEQLPAFAKNNKGAIETQTLNLGPVERVLGKDVNTRFAHVWVKRPEGWRALVYLDTPIPEKESDITPHQPTEEDKTCENPCKTLPYNPTSAAQKEVMAAWEKIKTAEWRALPEEWDARTAPEHVSITAHYFMPKAQRLALLAKQKEAYGWGYAGSPVVEMQLFDFKNAVVMITRHTPKSNGKQPCNLRLFVKRGTDWKIILSIQNDVELAGTTAGK
jgi:hypothetical protein